MVMTRKMLKAQKDKGFPVKEDNPLRKHMSYADAVKDNDRIKKERGEVSDLKAKQKRERDKALEEGKTVGAGEQNQDNADAPETQGGEQDQGNQGKEISEEQKKKIKAIEKKIAEAKGKPGAVSLRKELNAQIEAIYAE